MPNTANFEATVLSLSSIKIDLKTKRVSLFQYQASDEGSPRARLSDQMKVGGFPRKACKRRAAASCEATSVSTSAAAESHISVEG